MIYNEYINNGIEPLFDLYTESEDFTKYDKNHKTKSIDFKYEVLDINNKKSLEYLKKDSYCKKYLDYLSENTGEVIIDTDNNMLVGYVFVGKSKDKGFISTLHVNKKYRGYGFGQMLLDDAIKKYKAVDLSVDIHNDVAHDLYKKNGFKTIKSYDTDDGTKYYMKLSK